MLPELTREEILRYSRHLLIPAIGLEGQRKLKAASVLIIGTGGLGSPAALYLTAAGVGHIGIVDYDRVEESNLQRQVIHGMEGLGGLKVDSAKKRMRDLNPTICVDTYNAPFTSANAMQISAPYDVIIDGSDNFPTRYLTNDLCVLTKKTNIYGAVFQFDGQASVFDARIGPCYRCVFPEPPPPGTVPTCGEAGVLGILPGTIGTIQATETIKILLGIGSSLVGRLLLYNALDMEFEYVTLKKNPACKICGKNPDITHLVDYDKFCGVQGVSQDSRITQADREISPSDLLKQIEAGRDIQLIDVRERNELAVSYIEGAHNIPMGEFPEHLADLNRDQEIVIFCRTGIRSWKALEILLNAGFTKVKNLRGGINAWARDIDPRIPVY
jgi:molybdopterin/thiamine biosynthesis adenylyltransferase/rhodanese-related sulfurtransferase